MSNKNEIFNYYELYTELMLVISLFEWRVEPEKSLRIILKKHAQKAIVQDANLTNSKELLNSIIKGLILNLNRQIFILWFELMKNNVNDKMSTNLKNLRNKISTENKCNLNTLQLFEAIRHSITHNNVMVEIPNCSLNEYNTIEIRFKNNSFTLDSRDFVTLTAELISFLKEDRTYTYASPIKVYFNKERIIAACNNNKIAHHNITKFIPMFNEKDKAIILDNYQKQTLYNLLYIDKPIEERNIRLHKIDEYRDLFIENYPAPYRPHFIANSNVRCLHYLTTLGYNCFSRNDYINALYENMESDNKYNNRQTIDFNNIYSLNFESSLIGNILFNLFSLTTPQQLEPYFNDLKVDVKRIRNSIMHGRYYYNHNWGLEFYDGRNNDDLKHIGTLHFESVIKAINQFLEDNITKLYPNNTLK